jgi:hypothetical protein
MLHPICKHTPLRTQQLDMLHCMSQHNTPTHCASRSATRCSPRTSPACRAVQAASGAAAATSAVQLPWLQTARAMLLLLQLHLQLYDSQAQGDVRRVLGVLISLMMVAKTAGMRCSRCRCERCNQASCVRCRKCHKNQTARCSAMQAPQQRAKSVQSTGQQQNRAHVTSHSPAKQHTGPGILQGLP